MTDQMREMLPIRRHTEHVQMYFLCPLTLRGKTILILSFQWLDGKHVVFGKVIEGIDVVKAVEAIGSQSGKTTKVNH